MTEAEWKREALKADTPEQRDALARRAVDENGWNELQALQSIDLIRRKARGEPPPH